MMDRVELIEHIKNEKTKVTTTTTTKTYILTVILGSTSGSTKVTFISVLSPQDFQRRY